MAFSLSISQETIVENSTNSTPIGTFETRDVDLNLVSATYVLLNNAGGRFTLVGNELRVANGLLLDFEQQESFEIIVRVTSGGVTEDITKTIFVTDLETTVSGSIFKNETVTGSSGADTIMSDIGADSLSGDGGNDVLSSGSGNDVLNGGTGADTMNGAEGNDTYYVDDALDKIVEVTLVAGGTDTVNSSVTYSLNYSDYTDPNNQIDATSVEKLILTGAADINGTGNGTANTITGNSGNNVIDGLSGEDTMIGLGGNDTYYVDFFSDQVEEAAGGGTDTVFSSDDYSLTVTGTTPAREVENLTLTGAGNNAATGNAVANYIKGNTGNNLIDGKAGADTMEGGDGSDTYTVDNTGDNVVEGAASLSGALDKIISSVDFDLSLNGANVELLELTGTANIYGKGNSGKNTIEGNVGNNLIDGGADADTMLGGKGDDTYVLDNAADKVTESLNEGTDTVRVNATYFVSPNLTYTLGATLENLELLGTGNYIGIGNTLANQLTGNAGNNKLDGDSGADNLWGGAGNDTYVLDNVGDVFGTRSGVAAEIAGGGTDLVMSSITRTLADNFENLTLTGTSAINGTGNGAANLIVGNAAANTLDGLVGADTLQGGAGHDTYILANELDTVQETSGQGTDWIHSAFDYALSTDLASTGKGFLENLRLLAGTALMAKGNALNNYLAGNANNNTLDGLTGTDTMAGSTGNDTYTVDHVGDVVIEAAGEGTDTIRSSVSYSLTVAATAPARQVENLILLDPSVVGSTLNINGTGNTLNNQITGNINNNKLDGGSGADTLTGGAGNDTYVVDNSTLDGTAATYDRVIELSGGGTDRVQSSVSLNASTGFDFVEEFELLGTAALSITGNGLNNRILGNSGANTINGGAGNDTMAGGDGNDLYYVSSSGDAIQESLSKGTDTVQSTVSYTLAANVENLTLTGTANLNATGNTLANALIGNSGRNILDGKTGADVMTGGDGIDTYLVDNILDSIVETSTGGTDDLVRSTVSFTLVPNVEHLELTGAANINGTGNGSNNKLTGNIGKNLLNGMGGADTMNGGGGDDTYVVDNAGDSIIESLAGTTGGKDSVQSSVTFTLGGNLEDLTLTGTGVINGTGNSSNNALTGNAAINVLNGGIGNDTLAGGNGNDTLTGGAGADIFRFDTTPFTVTNTDVVTDYSVADDTIHLLRGVFSAISATGALSSTAFTVGAAATTAAQKIIYNAGNGQLLYDSDGSGSIAAIKVATLSAGLAMTASEFFIV